MSFWGDVGEFFEDAADVAIEGVEIAGDVCEVAAPIVMCVNPAAGTAMMQFAQYERMAEPYLEKAQAKLNDDESAQQAQAQAQAEEAQQGDFWHGRISDDALESVFASATGGGEFEITGNESLAELLAKIFGKDITAQQNKLRGLAEGGGKDAGQNALIQAAAADLQNLVAAASKSISSIADAQTTALGRTN